MRKIRLSILLGLLAAAGMAHAELLPYPVDTINEQPVYRYTVEKSIGLYRISVNFGVTQEEILRWNPSLQERGLHYGEVLLIPVSDKAIPLTEQVKTVSGTTAVPSTQNQTTQAEADKAEITKAEATKAEPAAAKAFSKEEAKALVQDKAVEPMRIEPAAEKAVAVAEVITVSVDSLLQGAMDTALIETQLAAEDTTAIRIALMLPFQAKNMKRDRNMDRFVDFYEGALLALYDLQQDGTHFVLDVFDTEKSASRVRALLDSGRLDHADVIIGLPYPMQLLQVSEWTREHHVPVLAPFTDRIDGIESNPYLFQFNPSADTESRVMVEWLKQQGQGVNCVLVEAKDADIPAGIRQLRKDIMESGVPYTTTTIRAILQDSLGAALKDSVENILIFNTEKYANIQVLMPRVLQAKGDRRLTLMTRYSWAQEAIRLPQVYTSLFVNEESPERAAYDALYARYFGHEHSGDSPRFDLLGYDMVREMVAYLQHWSKGVGSEYKGIQSHAVFERISDEGGYVNMHITVQHTEN